MKIKNFQSQVCVCAASTNLTCAKSRAEMGLNMKIVVAMDSFKGSLGSIEAGKAVAEGIRRADGETDVIVRPLADGGEGTVEALVSGMGGKKRRITVTGPLGEAVDCEYGIIEETGMAVIEMAAVAGLLQVPVEKRNPLHTTTYGLGEMLKDAVKHGIRRFLVGIGGSATNDGGAGMLQALGFDLLDKEGRQITLGAKGLKDLVSIDDRNILPELADCRFRIACDVTNGLCGPEGCSAIFGPQKGADADMVRQMDGWMEKYALLVKRKYKRANPERAGTGAAGGVGFAFEAFLEGALEPGAGIVLEETRLEHYVRDADLVITGEGRIDGQTVMGKAPLAVARLAKRWGKPTVALAGSLGVGAGKCNEKGIDAFFPILPRIMALEEAMETANAKKHLSDTAEQMYRLWRQGVASV